MYIPIIQYVIETSKNKKINYRLIPLLTPTFKILIMPKNRDLTVTIFLLTVFILKVIPYRLL
jgi:hypothetical protein